MKTRLSDSAVRAAENAQPDLPFDFNAYDEAIDAQQEYLLTLPFSEICDIATAQGLAHYAVPLLEKLAVKTLDEQFSPY